MVVAQRRCPRATVGVAGVPATGRSTAPGVCARSPRWGRPPFDFGRSGGNSGPATPQKSSGTKPAILAGGNYVDSPRF